MVKHEIENGRKGGPGNVRKANGIALYASQVRPIYERVRISFRRIELSLQRRQPGFGPIEIERRE